MKDPDFPLVQLVYEWFSSQTPLPGRSRHFPVTSCFLSCRVFPVWVTILFYKRSRWQKPCWSGQFYNPVQILPCLSFGWDPLLPVWQPPDTPTLVIVSSWFSLEIQPPTDLTFSAPAPMYSRDQCVANLLIDLLIYLIGAGSSDPAQIDVLRKWKFCLFKWKYDFIIK